MSIEIPDWVIESALLASFRVACEHTGTEFSDDEFRNARNEHDRENRNVASEMMRAALTAALEGWLSECGTTYYDTRDASLPTQVAWVSEPSAKTKVFTLRKDKTP